MRALLRVPYATLIGLLEFALLFLVWAVFLQPGPVSGELALARGARPGIRVLFVGDSLTAANGMTLMVRDLGLGDPGARPLYVVQYAVKPCTTLVIAFTA